jgi:Chaperone of endosialidase
MWACSTPFSFYVSMSFRLKPSTLGLFLCFALALIGVTTVAWGQFASKTGDAAGTAGGACNSSANTYAWPDPNGQILKCMSNVWTVVTQTAGAAGSTGQVQFNASGALAGSANLFWNNGRSSLGIGTATPAATLDVYGAIDVSGQNGISYPANDTTTAGTIAIGSQALAQLPPSAAYGDVAIGYQTLSSASMTTTATQNTAIGYQALQKTTSGAQNVAIGYQALQASTSGGGNVAIGQGAAANLTNSFGLIAIGPAALGGPTPGSGNIGIGYGTFFNGGGGNNNIAIGYLAGNKVAGANNTILGFEVADTTLTSGSDNILIGNDNTTDTFSAGTSNAIAIGFGAVPGTGDIAIGYHALLHNPGDNLNNTAIGYQTLSSASMTTAASFNTAVGYQVLTSNTTGAGDTAIGYQALLTNSTGNNNTGIGYNVASTTLNSGANNILIGTSNAVDTPLPGTSNFLDIGNVIFATGMTGSVSSPAGSVGIGVSAPAYPLHVAGNIGAVTSAEFGGFILNNGSRNVATLTGVAGGNDNGDVALYNSSTQGVDIRASGSSYINGGSVGIGTTAPAYLLHVGSASASGIIEELQNSSGACTFTPSSSALTTICSSDQRLKEDIEDAGPALPQLSDMRVRDYTIKASGERATGVIAQEMLRTHPDLVHMGPEGMYGVEAPNVWLLVKAIQELKATNDDLTDRLSADEDALKSATDSVADLRESFQAYKSAHP